MQVTTSVSCAWTATSDDWIFIRPLDVGDDTHAVSGAGPMTIPIEANPWIRESVRTGTFKVRWDGGGTDVVITQPGSGFGYPPCPSP